MGDVCPYCCNNNAKYQVARRNCNGAIKRKFKIVLIISNDNDDGTENDN